VALSEQVGEPRPQALLGALAHHFKLRPQQVRLEARHQTLGQLAQPAAAVGQLLPLVDREQMEHGGMLWRYGGLAEVQRRDDHGPWVDVGRQQAGALGERVDEGALAGLDLSDDGDAAGALLQLLPGGFQERGGMLAQQSAQSACQGQKPHSDRFQRDADSLRPMRLPGEARGDLPAPRRHQGR
jgi:hypothetical protein